MLLWAANLHKLQPKCTLDSGLIDHAIAFFHATMVNRQAMVRSRL